MNKSAKLYASAIAFAFSTISISGLADTYTDRASFEAAVNNLKTLDFEGLIGTQQYPQNYPPPRISAYCANSA